MNARTVVLCFAVALAACGRGAPPAAPAPAAPVASPNDALGDAPPVREGPGVDALRRAIPLQTEGEPLAIAKVDDRDIRRERAYPMQPPTIPHAIDGYQLDRNVNKCMDCHSRNRAEEFQAVPVSVTHYMDRDGNFLAAISPRRYFCTACHVVQHDAKPVVDNAFTDVDTLLRASGEVVESDAESAAQPAADQRGN
jgi:cytochrome c-type protein NapB